MATRKSVTITPIPSNTTDTLTVKTSNSSIAKLDSGNGTLVESLTNTKSFNVVSSGVGTATLIATCGNISKSVPITVTKKSSSSEPVDNMSTATEVVNAITVGWNLGNTFDATSWTVLSSAKNRTSSEGTDYEKLWIGFTTTQEMIQMVHDAGFNAIRIPVTWGHHIVDADQTGNNITIAPAFISRVKEVVDYAYDLGMFVMINTHHDTADYSRSYSSVASAGGGSDAISWSTIHPYQLFHTCKSTSHDASDSVFSIDTMCGYMTKLWTVIANYFKDYDNRLIFEGFNEILGCDRAWLSPTSTEISNINKLNQAFINAVRATGGNNATRILSIETYGAYTSGTAVSGISFTDTMTDGIILHAHLYTSTETSSILTEVSDLVKAGYPTVLGEIGWGVNDASVSGDVMHDFAANFIYYMKSVGIKCFWWDIPKFASNTNGQYGLLDRQNLNWRRPKTLQGLFDGFDGNIEPDATTNYTVTTSDLYNGVYVVKSDTKNSSDTAAYGKTPGTYVEATSYGRLCMTMTCSGTNTIKVLVGNENDDTIAVTNAFALKRYAFFDSSHRCIESHLKITNSLSTPVPDGTAYVRFSFAQIYTEATTSADMRKMIDEGRAYIIVRSYNEMSVDKTQFEVNGEVYDATRLEGANFTAGRLKVASDGDGDAGQISTDTKNMYGLAVCGFTNCSSGDTISMSVTSPGVGENVRIIRYVWYTSDGTVIESHNLPAEQGDGDQNRTFTCPSNGYKLRVNIANPYYADTFTSAQMISYLDSDDVIVKAVCSSSSISREWGGLTNWIQSNTIGFGLGNSFTNPTGEVTYYGTVSQSMIDAVANAGFKFVRIMFDFGSAHWSTHNNWAFPDYFINNNGTDSTDMQFTITSSWLERIKDVLGYCQNAGLSMILCPMNWMPAYDTSLNYSSFGAIHFAAPNNTMKTYVTLYLKTLWKQLSEYFKSISSSDLIFEVVNEPLNRSSTYNGGLYSWGSDDWYGLSGAYQSKTANTEAVDCLTTYITESIEVIRGISLDRYILCPTYAHSTLSVWITAIWDAIKTYSNTAVAIHWYYPQIICGSNVTSGATFEESEALGDNTVYPYSDCMITALNTATESGIPIVMTEGSVIADTTRVVASEQVKWANWIRSKFVDTYKIPFALFDNGVYKDGVSSKVGSGEDYGFLDRSKFTWRNDSVVNSIIGSSN